MNLQADSKECVGSFLSRHADFLVVGGHAVAFHGYPRLTEDLDLFVRPTHENARRLVEALKAFGFASPGLEPDAFTVPDRDSRDDIVVGAAGSDSVFVLRGLGSGQLGEVRVHEAGNLGLLASGDADEDGYPELLSAPVFQSGKPLLLLRNRSSPWTDLGFGLSASFGQPTLQATGPGEADLPITLGWSGALPPSQGFLVAGLSAALLPFHGGTLVPEPQVTLPVHAQGEISVRWPAGVTEGTQLFVQGWFFGPQADPEFSATQAVVLTTP